MLPVDGTGAPSAPPEKLLERIEKFPSGFAASIHGGAELRRRTMLLAPMQTIRAGEIPLSVHIEREGFAQKRARRPLVVILPGTYNEHDGPHTRYLTDILAHQGYHVLGLPNPMAKSMLSRDLGIQPLEFVKEAQLMRSLIREGIRQIGPENVSEVHLYGLSYGGFLTKVVDTLDGESRDPILSKPSKVRIVAPPMNFRDAIARMDTLLDQTEATWRQSGENSFFHQLSVVTDYFTAPDERSLSDANRKTADAIFAHYGFRMAAAESLGAYHDTHGLNVISDREAWARHLRFREAIPRIAPRGWATLQRDDLPFMHYWLERGKRTSPERDIFIVTAADDFFNGDPGQGARKARQYLRGHTDDAWILPAGGHAGFESDPEFQKVIKDWFPLTTPRR